MSNKSSNMKKKGGNVVNKKMMAGRMDDMANLMVAMEATLMEWEVWYRLIKMQRISLDRNELSREQYDFFIQDGPIFTDMPAKIMSSIRQSIPDYVKEKEQMPAGEEKPAILGADGFAAQKAPAKIVTN